MAEEIIAQAFDTAQGLLDMAEGKPPPVGTPRGFLRAASAFVRVLEGEVSVLRHIIYKAQAPENANKFWTEFLSEDEKTVVRRAVVANI